MERKRFGELDVVLCGGSDGAGDGEGPLVVLLHGFGAPGTDLVPLAGAITGPSEVRFAFPAAPVDLSSQVAALGGLVPADARAWWLVDVAGFQRALEEGRLEQLADADPPGLADAQHMLEGCLSALLSSMVGPGGSWVLGGFSQGGMLAVHQSVAGERQPDGLIVMSGGLVGRSTLAPRLSRLDGVPVFQSHGRRDPVVPFALGVMLRDAMKDSSARVHFEAFNGGHEIPGTTVTALTNFLHAR